MNELNVEYLGTEVDNIDSVVLFKCEELGINIRLTISIVNEGTIKNLLLDYLMEHPQQNNLDTNNLQEQMSIDIFEHLSYSFEVSPITETN